MIPVNQLQERRLVPFTRWLLTSSGLKGLGVGLVAGFVAAGQFLPALPVVAAGAAYILYANAAPTVLTLKDHIKYRRGKKEFPQYWSYSDYWSGGKNEKTADGGS